VALTARGELVFWTPGLGRGKGIGVEGILNHHIFFLEKLTALIKFSMAMVLDLQCAPNSPGELVETQIAGPAMVLNRLGLDLKLRTWILQLTPMLLILEPHSEESFYTERI
jgi:hypothetical protein